MRLRPKPWKLGEAFAAEVFAVAGRLEARELSYSDDARGPALKL